MGSAVKRTGSQMRKELEAESSNNSESDVSSEEDEARDQDDDYVLEKKFNVSASFEQYRVKCEEIIKQEGFYVDGNLHQILH